MVNYLWLINVNNKVNMDINHLSIYIYIYIIFNHLMIIWSILKKAVKSLNINMDKNHLIWLIEIWIEMVIEYRDIQDININH